MAKNKTDEKVENNESKETEKLQKTIESLSPNERKVLPHLEERSISDICKKSNLDRTSVLRSLEYLQNKKIISLSTEKKKVVDLNLNGLKYQKNGLPERQLLNLLDKKRIISFADAEDQSSLNEKELKVAIGTLKNKAMIDVKNGKIYLKASAEEVAKKTFEEALLEALPLEYDQLRPEQMHALKKLQKRKDIVQVEEKTEIKYKITSFGKEVINSGIDVGELVEAVTPEILKNPSKWKGKKFRRYDVTSEVPEIFGGKRHFVNQATDYARKVWTEMGFEEMSGNIVESSFWVFDSLFTPQDHPARDLQDTFFIDREKELPDSLCQEVKKAHEEGVAGSTGWKYNWDPKKAKKLLTRTHTTCLSSKTLASLKKEDLPKKYFSVGRCFRNETVDWKHSFEFNQTEGIVVDPDANFRHLLGYLKQFAKKMGYKKVRFRPAYFPYTEPSVEGEVWNPEKKEWVEVFAAGIFRPEVTKPLLGEAIPVLAWGLGFDRMILNLFNINDLRDLYKNDIKKLRETKNLMK